MSAVHNNNPRHVHILVTHALCDPGGSAAITVTVDPRIGLDVCIRSSGVVRGVEAPIETNNSRDGRSDVPEALYLYVQ
ncbi:MAG: hypothetical protein HY962_05330 [Ignavibacteriae bacterium]|nr:hypothetical protein [Ignavibacteriota bacterium]